MHAIPSRRRREGGQVLVVFALSVVVLLAFGGLALDGGSTFAQRRDEQTAADLAALAGANDYLINGSHDQAVARARSTAASNGYTHGTGGTSVEVEIDTSNGIGVTVAISALHRNTIVGLIGMPTWTVGVCRHRAGRLPGHGAWRLAVHLRRRPSPRRVADYPTRPTSVRATATCRPPVWTSPGRTSAPAT